MVYIILATEKIKKGKEAEKNKESYQTGSRGINYCHDNRFSMILKGSLANGTATKYFDIDFDNTRRY